jgi:hypothetical protein
MKDVNSYGNLELAAGASTFWSNGKSHTDATIDNAVYLTGAVPAKVKVSLVCKNFSEAATVTLPLVPHKSPVAGDAYVFPYAAADLRPNEYMRASAVHWANGGATGTQIFAHDVGCSGWDSDSDEWSDWLPGTDGSKNEHFRVWGKSLRALAAGTVQSWLNDMDNNTVTVPPSFPATLPPPADGSGNHIVINYGTEVVTCCHLQKGSIPAALQTVGAPVAIGQLLGLVGNSGNAGGPHTHIECERASDNALRPLPFRDAWVIDQGKLTPPGAIGPWFRLHGHGISKDTVSIWPLRRHPEWLGWQDLGGPINAPPAAASWAPHRLDIFSTGADGKLNHKWWDGSVWHNWQTLGGVFKGGPAAVSWGPNRIDVFVRGTNDHLMHLHFSDSQWSDWKDLGGTLTSAPAVSSWAENRLDVFAAGPGGKLQHKWWDGAKWHDWQTLGGVFKGGPAAVSWGSNRIDVFVRGTNDHLMHLHFSDSQWSAWKDLGGTLTSAPAVSSWDADRLDVFAAGSDANLQHKWWDGSTWSEWEWVGGVFHDNPAAVSWGSNRIDVFVNGMDNHLGHLWRG